VVKSAVETHPRDVTTQLVLLAGVCGVVLVIVGLLGHITTFWAAGAVLILFALVNWPRRSETMPSPIEPPRVAEQPRAVRPKPACDVSAPIDPADTSGLVRQMLAQHRYALLLRSQIAANLEEAQFVEALETLQKHMALVPDGEVTLGPADETTDDEQSTAEEPGPPTHRTVRVRRFFLDRYPVTNRQYFEFVAAGGYQQLSLWDESVLPAVLDFVDRTGEPGPRFWKEGCFLEGTDDHPVVGVSWHETVAYARWVGKRLPSDAEWVKAGAWPVPLGNHGRVQRKYPWGDDMDRGRANLWESGPGAVVGVREFAAGVSPGGVYQLVGNVWEWTGGDFHGGDHPLGKLTFKMPMKSIRGGAFDTYFDSQATCQFASGDTTLARKSNIGFRLAIGVCDLVLDRSTAAGATGTGFVLSAAGTAGEAPDDHEKTPGDEVLA